MPLQSNILINQVFYIFGNKYLKFFLFLKYYTVFLYTEISVAILCMVNHTVENENNSLEYSNLKSSTNCRFYNSSSRDNIVKLYLTISI